MVFYTFEKHTVYDIVNPESLPYPAVTLCAVIARNGSDVFSNEDIRVDPNVLGPLERFYSWNYGKYYYSTDYEDQVILGSIS